MVHNNTSTLECYMMHSSTSTLTDDHAQKRFTQLHKVGYFEKVNIVRIPDVRVIHTEGLVSHSIPEVRVIHTEGSVSHRIPEVRVIHTEGLVSHRIAEVRVIHTEGSVSHRIAEAGGILMGGPLDNLGGGRLLNNTIP